MVHIARLLVVGCFGVLQAAPSKLKVAICYPPENPPYEVLDADGSFRGYDVDVWNHVYSNLRTQMVVNEDSSMLDVVGTESPDFIPMPFDHILANLTDNNIDIGLCNVFVTPERAKLMDFSAVYIQTGLVAVLKKAVSKYELSDVLYRLFASFNAWARFSLLVILASGMVFAHLVWLCEKADNPHFRRPYGPGLLDGTWFALITACTVGYGDKVPITNLGKAVTVIWLFTGTFLVCILYAAVTSGLIIDDLAASSGALKLVSLPRDLKPYKIGTAISLAKRVVEDRLPGINITKFPSRYALFRSLLRGDIDVALEKPETSLYYSSQVEEFRGKLEVTEDVFAAQASAIAVSRPGGQPHPLFQGLNIALLTYMRSTWAEFESDFERWFGRREDQESEQAATERETMERDLGEINRVGYAVLGAVGLIWTGVLFWRGRHDRKRASLRREFKRMLGISEKYSVRQLRIGATRLFHLLDADQNGYVDIDELSGITDQMMRGGGAGMSRAELMAFVLHDARRQGISTRNMKLYLEDFIKLCLRILLHHHDEHEGDDLKVRLDRRDLVRLSDDIDSKIHALSTQIRDLQGVQRRQLDASEYLVTNLEPVLRQRWQRLAQAAQLISPSFRQTPSTDPSPVSVPATGSSNLNGQQPQWHRLHEFGGSMKRRDDGQELGLRRETSGGGGSPAGLSGRDMVHVSSSPLAQVQVDDLDGPGPGHLGPAASAAVRGISASVVLATANDRDEVDGRGRQQGGGPTLPVGESAVQVDVARSSTGREKARQSTRDILHCESSALG